MSEFKQFLSISASAGSGKTFRLAHRYISLLAKGEDAESILAMTFSRKAAGEIFDSIVRYLVDASTDPESASELSENCGEQLSMADCNAILRKLVFTSHRLRISTLDSFTINIVKTFPMELNIPWGFELMDEDGSDATAARFGVLRSILMQRDTSDEARASFLENFKLATFGREEKSLHQNLNLFITEHHSLFTNIPDIEAWGNPERIWSGGNPWVNHAKLEYKEAEFLECLASHQYEDKRFNKKILEIATALLAYNEKSAWTKTLDNPVVEKLIGSWVDIREPDFTVRYYKEIHLPQESCAVLQGLILNLIQIELNKCLKQTSGIGKILSQYEKAYNEQVRRQGKLTFEDTQRLLTPYNKTRLSQESQAEHLMIHYRLDGKFKHWLLDEFQDTNNLQWEVCKDLTDEVIQGDTSERSFFYVGDVKQAIYNWRGGNAALFDEIREPYAAVFEEEFLTESYRSGQAILDVVNECFEAVPKLGEFSQGCLAQWEPHWAPHQAAHETASYVSLIEPAEVERYAEKDACIEACVSLIEELDPLSKGIEVAILVRSNNTGRLIADAIKSRCPEMFVNLEGRSFILDNEVNLLLINLLRFAGHPGDEFARQHILMSPLAANNLDDLAGTLLEQIHNRGFAETLQYWIEQIDQLETLNAYARSKTAELLHAASEFDLRNDKDIHAFISFTESKTSEAQKNTQAVRVMTIHQSKGLGFDMVILPDLMFDKNIIKGDKPSILSQTDGDPWVMQSPRDIFLEADPVLKAQSDKQRATSSFEALCRLYVALTRAKKAMYIITHPINQVGDARPSAWLLKTALLGSFDCSEGNEVHLANETYNCIYEHGDKNWAQAFNAAAPPSQGLKQIPADFKERPSLRSKREAVAPSSSDPVLEKADRLFEDAHYFTLGTAVHELFEEIDWYDEKEIKNYISRWEQKSNIDADDKKEAISHFRKALSYQKIHEKMSPPDDQAKAFNELPFSIQLNDQVMNGFIDRLILWEDKAEVIDFKTNPIRDEAHLKEVAEHYSHQMDAYRKVLSKLYGIAEAKIKCSLLFTREGQIKEV